MSTKKQHWAKDPIIAEDSIFWKPKSELWFWLSVLSFVSALLVNIFIPSKEVVIFIPYRIFVTFLIVSLLIIYAIGLKNPNFRKKVYHWSQFVFAVGMFFSIWDLLTTKSGFFPLPYFPGIAQIINIMFEDRALLSLSALYSFRLFFLGMISGTIFGLASGILTGWSRQWDYWLSPIIRVSGIIPAIVWLPMALVIFPSSFTAGVFLIFIASWFPVTSMTAAGIIATPKTYFELAKTLGANEKFLLFRVAIPYAMPNMFIGILTAAAFSFVTLIVSEMVGAKAGLGYYINWAKGWGSYDKMYAAIIIIAMEFALILSIIGSIRRYVLRWQKGILK
ncbi:MAG: ABC transporter permease subunit [Elusimicrobiota bacterium]|jgi:NitT/TauT family transport system permease protein|nr:ABC transporter permease subunit [Elusimicrobiota bacterium]